MSLVVTITGSPAAGSRTAHLTDQVGAALARQGFEVAGINVRDLPAEDLHLGTRVIPRRFAGRWP